MVQSSFPASFKLDEIKFQEAVDVIESTQAGGSYSTFSAMRGMLTLKKNVKEVDDMVAISDEQFLQQRSSMREKKVPEPGTILSLSLSLCIYIYICILCDVL
tara:strand:+ start:381 stop:686 length:306 start_codon:yes stop_codon:yes gene_type:complete